MVEALLTGPCVRGPVPGPGVTLTLGLGVGLTVSLQHLDDLLDHQPDTARAGTGFGATAR